MEKLNDRVKNIAYKAVENDKIIGKTLENAKTENGAITYEFKGYKFNVTRREFLDVNGNPIYLIKPVGWINELPKIDGYRRSFKKWNYSAQSYNIKSDMYYFFLRLNVLISKAKKDENIFNK